MMVSQLGNLIVEMGFDCAVGVPDSQLTEVMVVVAASVPVYITPREDVAVAVACGLVVGGRRPILYMKNAGLFACGDALLSLARDMGLGLFILVGWSGSGADSLAHHVVTGERTVQFLTALDIPYCTIDLEASLNASKVILLHRECYQRRGHAAVLIQPWS